MLLEMTEICVFGGKSLFSSVFRPNCFQSFHSLMYTCFCTPSAVNGVSVSMVV